jgi:alkaline phosphatase D
MTKLFLVAYGFFNAYGSPVRKDSVDYVLHLGDYIYESKNGKSSWGSSNGRVSLPDREIYTLVRLSRSSEAPANP